MKTFNFLDTLLKNLFSVQEKQQLQPVRVRVNNNRFR